MLQLVGHLPDTSQYVTALSGEQWRGWSYERHLLAGIFDAVQGNTHASVAVAGGKMPPPQWWPRPDDQAKAAAKSQGMSMFEIGKAILAQQAATE